MEKINFTNGKEPAINGANLNQLQNNVETAITEVKEYTDSLQTYSEEEQVIGTWLGKPLYRKVVNTGALLNNEVKRINHNIANIDKIIKLHGYAYDGATFHPLPYTHISPTSSEGLYATKETISITTGIDRTTFAESCVVLEYTKTTD